MQYSASLTEQLLTAYRNKGNNYRPRTRYLDDSGQPRFINRLILEDSPYLLQHAHNPVDWFPWGEEAFNEAHRQNKPVFLSIGYSTCHWCHVMEEESFDNEDVAQVMNDYFICIKVDRELHPDVDTYYMTAVMMMQGQGGWPMSSFLTPERKPFFGATYFRPGQFLTLMHRVNELWQNQRNDLLEQAYNFSQQVAGAMAAKQSLNEIGINVIDLTAQALMNHQDPKHGGFGQAPKFPNEPYLYFLLDYIKLREDRFIQSTLTQTLHIMACGGIYDHVGGGFHRYATDQNWLVPHFEKMLYNQANLACVYTEAWLLTGEKDFRRIAEETLDYVAREMTNPEGGFYSATDADSEGEEGLFFTWEQEEIEKLLGPDATEFIQLYQVTAGGNFEGRNIPHLQKSLAQYASDSNLDYEELLQRLNKFKQKLMQERNTRIPPLRDDKIITAWNGMMIKTFALAGNKLDRKDYVEIAKRAAKYVLAANRLGSGSLSRSSLNNYASIPALQEDYAYLGEALVELYDASGESTWLEQAMSLTDQMLKHFWDQEAGGFFMAEPGNDNLLPYSPKETQDNATASGNSVGLKLLGRLSRRCGQHKYQTYSRQLIRAFSDDITQRPYISSYMMGGLLELLAGEQDNQQWCCDGQLMIQAHAEAENDSITITITVDSDHAWHLNAQAADNDETVPFQLEVPEDWLVLGKHLPGVIEQQVAYQDEPARVYPGRIKAQLKLERKEQERQQSSLPFIRLGITLQACTHERCLAPEKIVLLAYL